MTCIVGMIDRPNNCVYIGGDSAESCGGNIYIRSDKKVFKRGPFVIGCTTSFRMIQLLQYSLVVPDMIPGIDIHQYLSTSFIDSVRQLFTTHGFLSKDMDGTDMGGAFLIGYKDRLFKVQPDFQVSEYVDGYATCGSGDDLALGCLYGIATCGDCAVEGLVITALECATKFNKGVSAPYTILNTKS